MVLLALFGDQIGSLGYQSSSELFLYLHKPIRLFQTCSKIVVILLLRTNKSCSNIFFLFILLESLPSHWEILLPLISWLGYQIGMACTLLNEATILQNFFMILNLLILKLPLQQMSLIISGRGYEVVLPPHALFSKHSKQQRISSQQMRIHLKEISLLFPPVGSANLILKT